jgi:hypothetical protein
MQALLAAIILTAAAPAIAASSVCPLVYNRPAANQPTVNGEEAALLFSSYNQIWGPVMTTLPYSDPASQKITQALYPGALRFCGGTVANYWSLKNGNYTQPCSNPTLPFGNFCEYQEQIEHVTFSEKFTAQHFVESFMPVLSFFKKHRNQTQTYLPFVFDLNLLTLSGQQMLDQVDVLEEIQNEHPNLTLLVEFGNEYFLPMYLPVFPDSQHYIDKFTPLSKEIRARLPNAKIAVVTDPSNPKWDAPIAAALKNDPTLFDAVTVHNYNCEVDVFAKGGNQSMALFGPSVLPKIGSHVRKFFGPDTKIWNTEFNTGVLANAGILNAHNMSYSIEHALFVLNWQISAACETSGSFLVVMFHMLWQQRDLLSKIDLWPTGWGIVELRKNQAQHPADDHTKFSAMAQIMARVSFAIGSTGEGATCMMQQQTSSPSASCDSFRVNNKTEVDCVRGIMTGNQKGWILTNGCAKNISVTFGSAAAAASRRLQLSIFRNGQGSAGGAENFDNPLEWFPLSECPADREIWECGPVVPQKTNVTVPPGTNPVVELPALSIVFVDV